MPVWFDTIFSGDANTHVLLSSVSILYIHAMNGVLLAAEVVKVRPRPPKKNGLRVTFLWLVPTNIAVQVRVAHPGGMLSGGAGEWGDSSNLL